MSDFTQTMRDWKRMCSYYEIINEEDPCEPCPLFSQCGAVFEMDSNTDWDKYKEIISAWAAANPEPQYPTWLQFLYSLDDFPTHILKGNYTDMDKRSAVMRYVRDNHISANIAQKLGLEPIKE